MNKDKLCDLVELGVGDENVLKILSYGLGKNEVPIKELATFLSSSRRETMTFANKITDSNNAKIKIGRRGKETRLIFTCNEAFKSAAIKSILRAVTLEKAKKIYRNIVQEGAWAYSTDKSLKNAVVSSLENKLELTNEIALRCFSEIDSSESINENTPFEDPEIDVSKRIECLIDELKKITSAKEVNLTF
jgi:hypothetical protein